jgi:hypothetical protein
LIAIATRVSAEARSASERLVSPPS